MKTPARKRYAQGIIESQQSWFKSDFRYFTRDSLTVLSLWDKIHTFAEIRLWCNLYCLLCGGL